MPAYCCKHFGRDLHVCLESLPNIVGCNEVLEIPFILVANTFVVKHGESTFRSVVRIYPLAAGRWESTPEVDVFPIFGGVRRLVSLIATIADAVPVLSDLHLLIRARRRRIAIRRAA